jgi:hypothetical protein
MDARRLTTARWLVPEATTLLAWLILVFAWAPLAYPGYFELYSGYLPLFNLNDLAANGWIGWLPPYGASGVLRADGILPYLPGLPVLALGGSAVTAVKMVFLLGILSGGLGAYAWMRRSLGEWPALVGSAAYVYLPAALTTIYARGAVGEAALLGLVPWAFWAADRALERRPAGAIVLGGIVTASLLAQAGLALWLALGLLLYGALAPARPGARLLALAGWGGGLALGLAALVPAIRAHGIGSHAMGSHGLEAPGGAGFAAEALGLHRLLAPVTGIVEGSASEALPFYAGAATLTLAVFGLAVAGRSDDLRRRAWLAAGLAAGYAILSTVLAAWLWQALLPLARTLSYPWQLALLAGAPLAWLAGLGARTVMALVHDEQGRMMAAAGMLAAVMLVSYPLLNPTAASGPIPEAPLAVLGDNEFALLSAMPGGAPGPGAPVNLLVRWQALRPTERDYTVFFHVVGEDGTIWGQRDTTPKDGAYPTSLWQPGEVVTDGYQALLPPDAPASGYRLELGLYDQATGRRLAAGADDKIVVSP